MKPRISYGQGSWWCGWSASYTFAGRTPQAAYYTWARAVFPSGEVAGGTLRLPAKSLDHPHSTETEKSA